MQRVLPKQADIHEVPKIIERKVLKRTYLPITVKEIKARYHINSYFKEMYSYLAQNKLPHTKAAIVKAETLAENMSY